VEKKKKGKKIPAKEFPKLTKINLQKKGKIKLS